MLPLLPILFSPWEERLWEAEVEAAHQLEKGHGRIEERWLEASEILKGYLDWPGLKQVCRIRRRRVVGAQESWQTVHAITSLSGQRADAQELLRLCRGHWGIENRLHCVRDLSFAEDACRVRTPPVAPLWRPCATAPLALLRRAGFCNTVEGLEHFAEHRSHTIRLIRYGRIK